MAFRRKDVKKASYYVWFLGAKESKGLRGEEFVLPVLHDLLDKERELEPSKVTLQVSNKGIKIIQNVPKKINSKSVSPSGTSCVPSKMEQIKHLIPHHAITCVVQEDDVVCCILLIFNPITKCPVHVHAYRCDSAETASALTSQLQTLIDRPENQKKFSEIEKRLALKGLSASAQRLDIMSSAGGRPNSDGRSTRTDGSDGTDDSYESYPGSTGQCYLRHSDTCDKADYDPLDDPKMNTMYESLAHELKVKLGNAKKGPILLPPRDYDTISRKHGNLTGIEYRKSTNANIVGAAVKRIGLKYQSQTRSESSGKSSGIGSEEALPVIQEIRGRNNFVEKLESTSEEEEEELAGSGLGWHGAHRDGHARHGQAGIPAPIAPSASRVNKAFQPRPVAVEVKPVETPRYYFPDPSFNIDSRAPFKDRLSSSSTDVRLKRSNTQANPDYLRRARPVVYESSPSTPKSHNSSQAGRLSSDVPRFRLGSMSPDSSSCHRIGHSPQPQQLSGNAYRENSRRSFADVNLCKLNY